MKNFLLGLAAAACCAAMLMAQAKINPTNPQPTCNMCPGTYVPLSELTAYTEKALNESFWSRFLVAFTPSRHGRR